MNIASASKWLFAAYVVQKHGDVPANRPYLNFTSGYSNFDNALCTPAQTVAECNNGFINHAEATAHTFHYQGGHMQQMAVQLGLGNLNLPQLASEVSSGVGSDVGLSYVEPQPPGGVRTSAHGYAVFLRKLLKGSTSPLQLGTLLGTQAVCTHASTTCSASPETAGALPEDFHYSLGHWVEDDPATTPSAPIDNRAYSSAGAFGFYPWVDFDRTLYGIVARQESTGETTGTGEGYSSLKCGRLIRLAWKSGTQQ
jgi:CubicO group peptidase (beta-lactamase class C family)